MADEIKKVLTIQTSEGERSVKSLRKEISDYRDALLNVEKGSKDWEDIIKKLIKAQEDLTSVTKIQKDTVDVAKDSIVGMEREYKNLYNTYKLLNEEQRNSDFGKNMAAQLETLSNKLNETKQGVGNFKDNIGRYSQSVMDAFSKMGISVGALQQPMKLATAASNGLGKSFKALIANPVGAVIMAVVVAFKALSAIADKVKTAIQGNEESQMRLKEAMSAFQPVIDGVANAFDWLGQKVVSVIEFFANAYTKIREISAAVTDFLGITNGARDRVREQAESYKEIAKAQNEITKQKREYNKLNAAASAEVERLREEAEATEDKAEKTRLLNEAKDKQAEIDQRNLELAEENLRILQLEAEKTANDAEANERLAAAEVAVEQARAQLNKNARTYTRQLNSLTKATNSGKSAAEEAAAKIKKMKDEVAAMSETIRKSHLSEIQKLQEEKQAWIEKYKAVGKATEEVEKYYDAQIEGVKKSQRKEEGKAYTDALKSAVSNDKSVQTLGIDVQMVDMLYSYLESLESASTDLAKSYLGVQFKNNIEAFFNEVLTNAQSEIKDKFEWKFSELVELDTEDLKQLEQNYNELTAHILDTVDFYGGTNEGESYEAALARLISEKQQEIVTLTQDIVAKGLPIAEEDQNKITTLELNLNGLVHSYESLGKMIEQNDEILNSKGVANFITNGLFGTGKGKQDINGFAMFDKFDDGIKKLHKGLYNSSKVWQDYGQAVTTVLDAVAGKWQHNIEKQLESGEISEDEAKKQFKQMKAMQYALAGINMASGIVQAFADPSLVTWYAKAAAAAAVAATGVAQMITISQTEMGSDNGSTNSASVATTPALIDSTPYSYTRTLQTAEEEEMLNQPQYVSVTDINSVQNKVNVREEQSSF